MNMLYALVFQIEKLNMQQQELIPLKQKNSQYQPDQQCTVIEYAQYLGFILPQDTPLLWIAKQGLKADLPAGWQAFTNKDKQLLFMNTRTNEVQQQHPLDDFYRDKYRVEKKKLEIMEREGGALQRINEENESEHTKTLVEDRQKQQDIEVVSPKKMTSSEFMQSSGGGQQTQTALMKSEYMSPQGLVTEESEPEEMDLIEEYNVKLADIYNNKLVAELGKIQLPKLPKPIENSEELRKLEAEVTDLTGDLRTKKQLLEDLRKQRIKKQKALIDMEVEFQLKKSRIVEAYRSRLTRKLQQQKSRKRKQLQDQFQKLVKQQQKTLLK